MTLRTPRRRISPRTKRRYFAIRNFLRRAIGSGSQHGIKINSGIAVNVSSLKHKICGPEQKQSEANKCCHCQHSGLEGSSRSEIASNLRTEVEKELDEYRKRCTSTPNCRRKQQEQLSESSSSRVETDTNSQREEDDVQQRMSNQLISKIVPVTVYDGNDIGYKKKKRKFGLNADASHALLRSPSTTTYENRLNAYSTTSNEVFEVPNTSKYKRNHKRSNQRSSRRDCIIEINKIDEPIHYYLEDEPKYIENKKQRTESPAKRQDRLKQISQTKVQNCTFDRDFIDDLIKRQYSPIRMFNRKTSDISQFSEPVCRDRMPHQPNNTNSQKDPNVSSYHEKLKYVQNSGLNNKLSVCDARLYGSKRRSRSKHHRNVDAYDSKYYDVIPVKEKSSPKAHRKLVEDNNFANVRSPYYMEVPPSPRSNRPRLNLRAQYYDQYNDYMVHAPPVKKACSPIRVRKVYIPVETDFTSESRDQEVITQIRARPINSKKCIQEELVQPQEMYHTYIDVQDKFVINDTLINKSQESCATDKTDKALREIKDLLQTFLSEIKNTSLTKSDSYNKNVSIQVCEHMLPSNATDRVSNLSNNLNRFQNFNPLHANEPGLMPTPISPPLLPPMTNPCCSVLPMCPMNMSEYVMPTPSFTCTAGMNNCAHYNKPINKPSGEEPSKENCEIDELIKEIHKLVAKTVGKQSLFCLNSEDLSARTNAFTRIGGGSCQVQHQDAQVGTTKLRCYSKSCEAIGSAMVAEECPDGSYSDTVLERMSLNLSIDTNSFETRTTEKNNMNNMKQRLNVLLNSLGLLKKRKKTPKYAKEVISQADSRVFVEARRPPPFPSDVVNYMMHGQEYASPPPYPPHHSPRHYCPHGDHEFGKYNQYSMREPVTEALPRRRSPLKHERGRVHSPSAPPYSPSYVLNPYLHPSQQGPLCLREVEVKSIATQSEIKKPSFFAKFAKKAQQNTLPMAYTIPTTAAPPAALQPPLPPQPSKRGLFSRGSNIVPQQDRAPQPQPNCTQQIV